MWCEICFRKGFQSLGDYQKIWSTIWWSRPLCKFWCWDAEDVTLCFLPTPVFLDWGKFQSQVCRIIDFRIGPPLWATSWSENGKVICSFVIHSFNKHLQILVKWCSRNCLRPCRCNIEQDFQLWRECTQYSWAECAYGMDYDLSERWDDDW